uniref:Uncharacterized protein n=1 Tax=Arundo donax TaxID=35708 RepID=A0A0A8ZS90_ARUDO
MEVPTYQCVSLLHNICNICVIMV